MEKNLEERSSRQRKRKHISVKSVKTIHNDYARRLRCEFLEDRRLLAVVIVDTVDDVVDISDGVTSLREAIFATNLVPGADEIVFDFGFDGPATILLEQGELQITQSRITGNTADIDGGGLWSIRGATTNVYDSLVSDNTAGDAGGGLGLVNDTSTIRSTHLFGNSALCTAMERGTKARTLVLRMVRVGL